MRDFGVVTARSLLKVTAISPIREFLPPSIIVIGEKLNETGEILYNGVEVSEFVIASPARLIVRIPSSQIGRALRTFQVFAKNPILQATSNLTLEVARPLRVVSGISRLVQAWLLIFFTNPGSDIFSPNSGGGGSSLIGKPTDRDHKSAAADLALSIERTKSELMRLQTQRRNIPLDEKLLSSDLESINYDNSTGYLLANVSLKNMLGQQASVDIR